MLVCIIVLLPQICSALVLYFTILHEIQHNNKTQFNIIQNYNSKRHEK